jgi:uncharacterized protein YecT (DUF1311 family)
MLKPVVLFLAIMLVTINSFAQPQTKLYKIDSVLNKCIKKNNSDHGMSDCLQRAESSWDKELNNYYRLLLTKLDTIGRKNLRESQRQWLIYKDKEIIFLSEVYSKKEGTMWDLLITDKQMQITRQRAIELSGYYDTLMQN